jgi:hypothetical protein
MQLTDVMNSPPHLKQIREPSSTYGIMWYLEGARHRVFVETFSVSINEHLEMQLVPAPPPGRHKEVIERTFLTQVSRGQCAHAPSYL